MGRLEGKAALVTGGLVSAGSGEVRDIDEQALREGRVTTSFYGELRIPAVGGYLQHTKSGGREDERLAVTEIVAEVVDRLTRLREGGAEPLVVLGPGGSEKAVGDALGLETTLLGFDVVRGGQVVIRDAEARDLDREVTPDTIVVMSFGRGQGILFGRGNQQLTPAALSRLPREHLWILATRSKLATLGGRPLHVDTGDPECDAAWEGLVEIITGYQDACYHRISAA